MSIYTYGKSNIFEKEEFFDDNGLFCIDIFLNGEKITAGFKSNSSEKEMMEDIKNIFNDISSEKTGVNHNIYF
tara:strand:- start:255 stop:473 length:219 start_codon:yes stop_codon:yes gene_type:complete